MSDTTHKCKMCGLSIKGHMPYCIYCITELKKKGLCVWCGEKPQKAKSKNGQQSRYCEECQAKAIAAFDYPAIACAGGYRTQDHRENTYETKHGRD